MNSPQDFFRIVLITVVGQAFGAAGYTLEERPLQWSSGLYRFIKALPDDLYGFIEFQLLNVVDTQWSAGVPSRFRVTLTRTEQLNPAISSPHSRYIRRMLSALVVEDFGVAILPSADHWWTFRDTETLGKALAEAGRLIVGYGMPWLSGDLQPPSA